MQPSCVEKNTYSQRSVGRINPKVLIVVIMGNKIKDYFLFSSAYFSVFSKFSKIIYDWYNC